MSVQVAIEITLSSNQSLQIIDDTLTEIVDKIVNYISDNVSYKMTLHKPLVQDGKIVGHLAVCGWFHGKEQG